MLKDIEQQAPRAICELRPRGVASTSIVNRNAHPFDNADLGRAMALTLDRRSFIDVLSGGQGDIGAAMLSPPRVYGVCLPIGYESFRVTTVQRNRTEARNIMERLGYGPSNPLVVKVAARNIPLYREPAVMLIDQLKEIYVAGELDLVETENRMPRSPGGITWLGSKTPPVRSSTTPTSHSMRAMRETRTATLPDTAIASSRICSTSNHARSTRKGASGWSGRSTLHCRRRGRARSSSTRGERPAGNRR